MPHSPPPPPRPPGGAAVVTFRGKAERVVLLPTFRRRARAAPNARLAEAHGAVGQNPGSSLAPGFLILSRAEYRACRATAAIVRADQFRAFAPPVRPEVRRSGEASFRSAFEN